MSVDTPSLDRMSEVGGPAIAAFLDWFLHEHRGQLCAWRDAVPATRCSHDGKSLDELLEAGTIKYPSWVPKDVVPAKIAACPGCGVTLRGTKSDRLHHAPVVLGLTAGFFPLDVTKEELIAEYAGVSKGEVDAERRAPLDTVQQASMASTERVP